MNRNLSYSGVLNDLMLINLVNLILEKTNPISSNWQWVCCVHVLLPIITRLAVSKDLHLEVPHHGVHHFPGGRAIGLITTIKTFGLVSIFIYCESRICQ